MICVEKVILKLEFSYFEIRAIEIICVANLTARCVNVCIIFAYNL